MKYITNQISLESTNYSVNDVIDYFKDKEFVQLDSETTGLFDFSNRILLLQVGDFDEQWVINWQSISHKDKTTLFDFLKTKKVILCNAKFDLLMLKNEGFYLEDVIDIFLMSCLLNAGFEVENNLRAIVEKYTGIVLDKTEQTTFKQSQVFFTQRQLEYAANDVKYLEICYTKMLKELTDHQMSNGDPFDIYTVLGLEHKSLHSFIDMEFNGLLLDRDQWKIIKQKINQEKLEIQNAIDLEVKTNPLLSGYLYTYQDLFTEPEIRTRINWSSPAQKLDVLKKLEPLIENTADKELSKYKHIKLVSLLSKYSKTEKLKTSFGDKLETFINPVTGRIHQEFWQILDTGRVSSNKPNMQQIPSRTELGGEMRKAFVPAKGFVMIGGDYSGCELRIIAELSQDPVWINSFLDKKDLHSELCSLTFGIPITDVKKPSSFKPELKYRDIQKTINFGLAYGMSKFKLSSTIEVDVETADKIIQKFFSVVPKVKLFLDRCEKFAIKYKYSYTPVYKRKRFFKGDGSFKSDGEIGRAGKNAPIQGANADMTKLALIYIRNMINENSYNAKIVHCVHDEIQCEVHESIAEEFKIKMEECMLNAAKYILKQVPMEIDCKIANCWSK